MLTEKYTFSYAASFTSSMKIAYGTIESSCKDDACERLERSHGPWFDHKGEEIIEAHDEAPDFVMVF